MHRTGNILKLRKHNAFSFIMLIFKLAPIQSFLIVLYTIVNSLMPAYLTLAIANFINTALRIFDDKSAYSTIYMPVILLMGYILFTNIIPQIISLVYVSMRNQLNIVLGEEMITKYAGLKYENIEDYELCKLVNRVYAEPEKIFFDGFNQITKGIGMIIHITSLIAIIMSSTIWGGMVILLVAIPFLILANKTGKKNYQLSVDATELDRKTNYLLEVLTEREYVDERKLFGYGEELREEYDSLYCQAYKIRARGEIKRYMNMKSGSMVTIVLAVIILAYLLNLVGSGSLDIGIFVLNECSFKLYKGKRYSFVGANGSGKTTITKLILGLYDTYQGTILINGRDIHVYKYAELKNMISIVFQDFAKYYLTIKDNINLNSNKLQILNIIPKI